MHSSNTAGLTSDNHDALTPPYQDCEHNATEVEYDMGRNGAISLTRDTATEENVKYNIAIESTTARTETSDTTSPPASGDASPTELDLTEEQKEFFIQHGYLHLENCFDATVSPWPELVQAMWPRLGMSATDPNTWTRPYTLLPQSFLVDMEAFSPKAYSATCQVVGGEERLHRTWKIANDFIVNLGTLEHETAWNAAAAEAPGNDVTRPFGDELVSPSRKELLDPIEGPYSCQIWHVDGAHFVHYLDSPEQGLVLIVFWTDVVEGQGPTVIAEGSIEHIARHLYDHPEGVCENMSSSLDPTQDHSAFATIARKCSQFKIATGKAGDVCLMHPLSVHSTSPNFLRVPRVITNPRVTLKEPLQYFREQSDTYSLVERATLRALGHESDGLREWKILGQRKSIEQIPRFMDRPLVAGQSAADFSHLRVRQDDERQGSTSLAGVSESTSRTLRGSVG